MSKVLAIEECRECKYCTETIIMNDISGHRCNKLGEYLGDLDIIPVACPLEDEELDNTQEYIEEEVSEVQKELYGKYGLYYKFYCAYKADESTKELNKIMIDIETVLTKMHVYGKVLEYLNK